MSKKLKPFDLKTALKGEPVMLRDGRKAFVRHHETELSTEIDKKLLGYIEGGRVWAWCVDGASLRAGYESQDDIIGMHPKTRIINGFEVPAPEEKPPEVLLSVFYTPALSADAYYSKYRWCKSRQEIEYILKRGLVFLNKEDAIANAKAMLGIDPNKPSMD